MITEWNELHFYKGIGKSLKIARERAGLNQSDIARLIGLTRTSITNMELGNQPISLYHASLIAEVLPEWRIGLGEYSPKCLHEWYHRNGRRGDLVCSRCEEIR